MARWPGVIVHSWPSRHRHLSRLTLPCVTVVGSNRASAASSGCVVARSLTPGRTALFAQTGQPRACPGELRDLTTATHSWPFSHRQGSRRCVPALTVVASNRASAASSGWVVARSLRPATTSLPAQTGHPSPESRSAGNGCNPFVAVAASPRHRLVAAEGDRCRIEAGLGHNLRVGSGKVVESHENATIGAVGAALSLAGAVTRRRHPFMTEGASPGQLQRAASCHRGRIEQRLKGQPRMGRRKIVVPTPHLATRTHGASCTASAACDGRHPRMAFRTAPRHLPRRP